jgi:hypothetical protein
MMLAARSRRILSKKQREDQVTRTRERQEADRAHEGPPSTVLDDSGPAQC